MVELRERALAALGVHGDERAAAPRRRARRVAPAVVLLVLLAVWELIVRGGVVDELLLPAPTQVAQALWEDRALLAPDLLDDDWEVVLGLAAALVLGAGLAVAMHLVPAVDRALRPLVVGSQAVPIPVVAPLIVLVLGFGLAPKILIIALICFFPIVGQRVRRAARQRPRRAQAAALAGRDALAAAALPRRRRRRCRPRSRA